MELINGKKYIIFGRNKEGKVVVAFWENRNAQASRGGREKREDISLINNDGLQN